MRFLQTTSSSRTSSRRPTRVTRPPVRQAGGSSFAFLALAMIAGCAPGSREQVLEFGPAITIAESGGTRPTIAVDGRDGTIYVAWIGAAAGATDLYLTRIEPGDSVSSTLVRVNDIPGDAAPHDQAPPHLAIGPEGNVYIAWQNNQVAPGRRFPTSNLRFARSTDRGRSFEPAIHVNDDAETGPPASHTFHDLAVSPDGTLAVSWIDGRSRLSGSAGLKAGPGEAHEEDSDDRGPEIRIAYSTDGGRSFGRNHIVDTNSCPCCRTAIEFDTEGRAYIAWRKILPGEIRDIVVARVERDSLGARSHTPIRPHPDDWRFEACPHAGPALLTEPDGALHIAWYTGREGRAGIHHAVSRDGGVTFGESRPIITAESLAPSQAALALSPAGEVMIAWEDRRRPERRIGVGLLEGGRFDVVDTMILGTYPAIASAGATSALAWLDGEAVRVRIAR